MRVQRQTKGMDKLMSVLDDLDKRKVEAGWFESAKYDDGTPVAGIMYQNEYGNAGRSIPASPFFRNAVADNKSKWSQTGKKGFAAVVQGKKTPDQILDIIGLQVVGDVKGAIEGGDFAPLSPITIALRRLRDDNVPIGGATVGAVAAAIREGKTGRGELGDQSYPNKKRLQDTGYALSTLTYEVS